MKNSETQPGRNRIDLDFGPTDFSQDFTFGVFMLKGLELGLSIEIDNGGKDGWWEGCHLLLSFLWICPSQTQSAPFYPRKNRTKCVRNFLKLP